MLKIFAEDLKFIREEKKISLKSISQQTRLNVTILESMESGDYTFQPQPYIRAFLKQYINSLGLDLDETLFDYDLARSGKYKSKIDRPKVSPKETVIEEKKKEEIEIKESSKEIDKDKALTHSDEIIIEEKKADAMSKSDEKTVSKSSEEIKPFSEDRKEKVVTLKHPEEKKKVYTDPGIMKKSFFSSVMGSPVVKNIVLILFILLVLLGIYSLINILFLEDSKDKTEIVRQNFDDVIKEQEKKILGARTPEEVQDSIRKAEEELALAKDSITLKITSINSGTVFLVIDSVNYNQPQKIEFEKNEVGIFKAQKSFFISSGNTESFKASVNNVPIKFNKLSVSKVKITKEGVAK